MNFQRNSDNRIAILGGSFNPIHYGHLAMTKAAYDSFHFANVLLMPNATTYYKENIPSIKDTDRLSMLDLVVKEYSYLSISDIEIKRGGITHTIDTVRELEKEMPDRKIYFIIGGDSLLHLPGWVEAKELFKKVVFLTCIREDVDQSESLALIDKYKKDYVGAEIELLPMAKYDISSSKIREMVRNGQSIKGLLPESVAEFIQANGLYLED